jgi:hypothetical protein
MLTYKLYKKNNKTEIIHTIENQSQFSIKDFIHIENLLKSNMNVKLIVDTQSYIDIMTTLESLSYRYGYDLS